MVYFIWDEYGVMTSVSSIKRILKAHKWSKKKVCHSDTLCSTLLVFHDELINRHKSALLKEIKSSEMHGQGSLLIIAPSNWYF